MRLIDRYICREVVSHASLGLAVFTFVFFIPQLVRFMELFVGHSGSAHNVILLFLCTLPPVFAVTLPMAVLVGVLIGLGRLSADSEIVALHACGISLRRLLVPIGSVAMVACLANLAITFWLSPAALRTVRRIEEQILISQAPFAIEPRVFDERLPHVVLYVQDVAAAATHWGGVFLASSTNQGTSITTAQDASIMSGPGGQLDIHLGQGSTHEYNPRHPDRYNVTTFGDSDLALDLSDIVLPRRLVSLPVSEQHAGALLSDNGPNELQARVEFQRRAAFPVACLVFALIGVPIGVRPRRGGRAAGLILTLVLIGGYYFLFVYGAHLAAQGQISVWLGVWAANIVMGGLGLLLFRRIESVRKPSRALAWLESLRSKAFGGKRDSAASRASSANGSAKLANTSVGIRRMVGAGSAFGFPMMIDVYLLQQFFYYFVVMLAAFVVIFDAFTLFDLLADISRNHIAVLTVVSYFRYLIPLMVYQLAPLAALVATLVTLGILAKNNELIAFKAGGISLYRLVLPLTLAGCLVAGGMFLLDDTFLPYANQRQDALRNEIKGRPAQTYLQPGEQWIAGTNNKLYNYEFFDSDQDLFGGLNVFELDPQTFQIKRRIYASRATWEPTENTWALTGGWVRDFDSSGRISSFHNFKVTSLPELTEPPSYFRREVRQYYQMNWRQLGRYIASLKQAGFDTARLSVEWHKKFAFPVIAAIIIFLSAPFGFLVGTRGAVGGIALAVGIAVVYWATAALFEAMGTVGQLPPTLAAWAPDAIFAFLGAYFFLRIPT
ncbi:MAG TPA: LPS export ABC transporter permease LptF [Candidatus Dormibacteraeota bacterium]|nr:LPS export ABC transporter permease LptF [Candidatus Dormibacteraeota bacterium]